MAIFQVSSRSEQSLTPPEKRPRRLSQEWAAVIRISSSMGVTAALFIALLDLTGSEYTFILLPVLLSLFINGFRRYNIYIPGPLSFFISRRFNLNMFLTITPLYLLLTFSLALVYYSVVTVLILLTHKGSVPIILISTALAWAVILEPARDYLQSYIERRFNFRHRESIKVVEAFTSTLREEIDLDQLRERFLTVIQQTMKPYSVSLWIHSTEQQQDQSISTELSEFTVADDDPLIAYMLHYPGVAEPYQLKLDSPLLEDLKPRRVELILPLASQGELLGLLLLGLRLNREEYTREDRALLNTLAAQVAPAIRVAQMVHEQQKQVRERERIEQELRTARAIQHAFLPKDPPALPGWQLVPYYQPAREVGGDFYDFLTFEDGRVGLIIGDVTGKGVPAALVMATVHTMLRTTVRGTASPGEVLARVNSLLSAEIPPGMFVTCFYALLDPKDGQLSFANAGHEPPYRRQAGRASELWATGMPLGLLPDTAYEEYAATLAPGESLLFYSDGLVEAHSSSGEMFGFPRLQKLLEDHNDTGDSSLIDYLLYHLKNFTGETSEQEDDVTLLMLERCATKGDLNMRENG